MVDEKPGAQQDKKSAHGYTTREQEIQNQVVQLQTVLLPITLYCLFEKS